MVYTADASSTANISLVYPFLNFSDVVTSALVLHAPNGTRVGCGVITAREDATVVLRRYPGYSGSGVPMGTLAVAAVGPRAIEIRGDLAGLPPSTSGGWHIHTGRTCSAASLVGGHLYYGGNDEWRAVRYSTSAAGAASIALVYHFLNYSDVVRRALVIHAPDGTRVACGIITPPSAPVAVLGTYPGSPQDNFGTGTLTVGAAGPNALVIQGEIAGILPSASGGWHIHRGRTCSVASQVGGHLYFGGSDPWNAVRYTADAQGVAPIALNYPYLDYADVVGRALVVHAPNGTRVACGIITAPRQATVLFGRYPGYGGPLQVTGRLTVSKVGPSAIEIYGELTGLQNSSTGGWHVHTGCTCAVAAQVGGHLYYGATDPWVPITYTTDSAGAAAIYLYYPYLNYSDVLTRALVVHAPSGTRVGCGIITAPCNAAVIPGPYPGGSYSEVVTGMLTVAPTGTSAIEIQGVLGGLGSGTSGGWHIHTGRTCSVASQVGGHLYYGSVDPWNAIRYSAAADGTAVISLHYAYLNYSDVVGRALVIHAPSGARIACGLITAPRAATVSFGRYPGYTGPLAVTGALTVARSRPGAIDVLGEVSGLVASSSGGWHVHTGRTCAVAAQVGGHLYYGATDPWVPVTYTANANGGAPIHLYYPYLNYSDVLDRALVVHAPGGTRVACGIITAPQGPPAASVVFGRYPGYTGPLQVTGDFMVAVAGSNALDIQGALQGLIPETTGGWHIHTGGTCSNATQVCVLL